MAANHAHVRILTSPLMVTFSGLIDFGIETTSSALSSSDNNSSSVQFTVPIVTRLVHHSAPYHPCSIHTYFGYVLFLAFNITMGPKQ